MTEIDNIKKFNNLMKKKKTAKKCFICNQYLGKDDFFIYPLVSIENADKMKFMTAYMHSKCYEENKERLEINKMI